MGERLRELAYETPNIMFCEQHFINNNIALCAVLSQAKLGRQRGRAVRW